MLHQTDRSVLRRKPSSRGARAGAIAPGSPVAPSLLGYPVDHVPPVAAGTWLAVVALAARVAAPGGTARL